MKRLGGNLQEGNAPVLHLRVSPQLLLRLRRRAKEKGMRVSRFVREVLREVVRG